MGDQALRQGRGSLLHRVAPRPFDLALGTLGISFGAVSLTYPLGRDQALFFYVGREWLERGAVPYRDVFEHKTPFVHMLHAFLIALTGENPVAIRAAELIAVVGIGLLASSLVVENRARARDGVTGAALLGASVFYYGYFPFQDTGNCEVWCALFALGALVAARRAPQPGAMFGTGALVGLMALAKPPSLVFALPIAYEMARHVRRSHGAAISSRARVLARAAALIAAGALAVDGPVVAYFAAHGALGAMIDVAVRANGDFVVRGSAVHSIGDLLHATWKAIDWFSPLSYIFLGVCALAITWGTRRGDQRTVRRYGSLLALAGIAYAATIVQLKFFIYHDALLLVPIALFSATIYDDVRARIGDAAQRSSRAHRIGLALAYAVVTVGSCLVMTPHDVWLLRSRNTVAWLAGRMTARDLTATFDVPNFIDMANSVRTGEWLKAHTQPTDTVAVRGYEPQIYAFAQRHYAGRFFWTAALTDPKRAYRRVEWLTEDRASLVHDPPRYVVAMAGSTDDVDSITSFAARGYATRVAFGAFTVMEGPPCATK